MTTTCTHCQGQIIPDHYDGFLCLQCARPATPVRRDEQPTPEGRLAVWDRPSTTSTYRNGKRSHHRQSEGM